MWATADLTVTAACPPCRIGSLALLHLPPPSLPLFFYGLLSLQRFLRMPPSLFSSRGKVNMRTTRSTSHLKDLVSVDLSSSFHHLNVDLSICIHFGILFLESTRIPIQTTRTQTETVTTVSVRVNTAKSRTLYSSCM